MMHMMRNLEIERAHARRHGARHRRPLRRDHGPLRERAKAFGKPIRELRADPALHRRAATPSRGGARATSTTSRARLDLEPPGNRIDSDAVKLFAADRRQGGRRQRDAGAGRLRLLGEYVVERLWRDAKLLEIGGGTIEAHQKNITKDLCRSPELVRR